MAINVVSKVPIINGIIPKCFFANNGVHCVSVINSIIETSLKKEKLSLKSTQSIPIVVNMVIRAEPFNMFFITTMNGLLSEGE